MVVGNGVGEIGGECVEGSKPNTILCNPHHVGIQSLGSTPGDMPEDTELYFQSKLFSG